MTCELYVYIQCFLCNGTYMNVHMKTKKKKTKLSNLSARDNCVLFLSRGSFQ